MKISWLTSKQPYSLYCRPLFHKDIYRTTQLVNSKYRFIFSTLYIKLWRLELEFKLKDQVTLQTDWEKTKQKQEMFPKNWPEFKDGCEYIVWNRMMATTYKQQPINVWKSENGK